MNYINVETGEYPVTPDMLRSRFANVIFPIPFEAPDGYAPVAFGEAPAFDPATHKAVELAPVQLEGGWVQQWEVVALTQQEIDEARRARVPAKVTRRQARQALLIAGLLDNVQPAIDAIADPVQRGMAQIEWDDSQDFERDRPLLIQLGHAIGLDDVGIDNLFIQAGAL